ncbi:hypothetical protein WA026_016830 [Henosepilachna vigintioctopunctata]|uniref:Uncharacterized protein n=1 Tax=Henosepilachna vigintioctopunctata TaxID=420089 RepID=A0AAW1U3F1_9CUCU
MSSKIDTGISFNSGGNGCNERTCSLYDQEALPSNWMLCDHEKFNLGPSLRNCSDQGPKLDSVAIKSNLAGRTTSELTMSEHAVFSVNFLDPEFI